MINDWTLALSIIRPRAYLNEWRRIVLGIIESHNVRRAERLEHLAVVRGRETRQRLIVRRAAANMAQKAKEDSERRFEKMYRLVGDNSRNVLKPW